MPYYATMSEGMGSSRDARVLVLDGEQRASLAVARSLVQSGLCVGVVASRRASLAGVSRGVVPFQVRADPVRTPSDFIARLLTVIDIFKPDVVVPITDGSMQVVLENRAALGRAVVPAPPLGAYLAASNKVLVQQVSEKLGIGVPRSLVIPTPNAAPEVPREWFPVYLKPHSSVVGAETREKTRVRRILSPESLREIVSSCPSDYFPVLVQGEVQGPGEGVFIARWNRRTVARFAHRRLREKPPGGGVSVYRESIELDPSVLESCERLLDALEWEGVAMIEGKRDAVSGRWSVMEINGRFWGSLQLAIDAGVDFPSILVRAALGDAIPPLGTWAVGRRLRWEWGEVDHLIARFRRTRQELGLMNDAPSRLGALSAFLKWGERDRAEVFRWNDPMPFLVETLDRILPAP